MSERDCPICARGEPLDVIGELETLWVTAPRAAPLPGYVCLVAKTHVAEPFELDPEEAGRFWRDVLGAARAVHELLRPRKLNYEIHGNTLEHLHVHVFPRYPGDPFEGRPIDGRSRAFVRSGEELARLRAAF